MEKKIHNKLEIPFDLHNRYEIIVLDKNNNVISRNIAYNQANSSAYNSRGYIDKVRIKGSRTEEKYIERYNQQGDDVNDITDFWDREGLPYYSKERFISCYKTKVKFYNVSKGYIDTIELLSGGGVVSSVKLKDIEGYPIQITYEEETNIVINIFIYFSANASSVKRNENKKFYPIKWYGPSGSVLGGCCGKQIDLLEQKNIRFSHYVNSSGRFIAIDDGYLPKAVNKYLALSRMPVPKTDENGFLTGVINSYTILKPNLNTGIDENIFKNSNLTGTNDVLEMTLSSGEPIMGLIRTFVLPGIGVIDMRDICGKCGPGLKGIFESINYYKSAGSICYIPQEYVLDNDGSLISMNKNAFYKAHVTVRRYRYNINDAVEDVPLNTVFFSDITTDGRRRRCMGFSQHVPLTDDYCGAESVIPCLPGGFKDENVNYYGYYITYTGGESGSDLNTYLKASYIVAGQIVSESASGTRVLETFPVKLEYSYNGVDFETAQEITTDDEPYVPREFGPIAAPIWRITGGLNSATVMAANNTTHSDKYVANEAQTRKIGYDPLFLFVGYYNPQDKGHNEGLNIPQGVKVVDTKQFNYNQMGVHWMEDQPNPYYRLTVPYLGHAYDNVYFTSDFLGGLLTGGE